MAIIQPVGYTSEGRGRGERGRPLIFRARSGPRRWWRGSPA
uniref:Uncharacterized protein n=1 Tax=Anguilla anguilla TaxID=7936 RepID=A0A0E9SGC0_ANGAN